MALNSLNPGQEVADCGEINPDPVTLTSNRRSRTHLPIISPPLYRGSHSGRSLGTRKVEGLKAQPILYIFIYKKLFPHIFPIFLLAKELQFEPASRETWEMSEKLPKFL